MGGILDQELDINPSSLWEVIPKAEQVEVEGSGTVHLQQLLFLIIASTLIVSFLVLLPLKSRES
jgi:hypothetical protein